jgi:small subunit ribosomal protein S13
MAEEEKKNNMRKDHEEEQLELVRVKGKDLLGRKNVLVGLTKIKGISWSFANAICKLLKIDTHKKVGELKKEEIAEIEDFIDDPKVPSFMKNRQKDFDRGEDVHLNGSDLKLKNEFDLKRLKKIRSYKGLRHSNNLPVRGQRTRSNFRRNRKKSGVTGGKKK